MSGARRLAPKRVSIPSARSLLKFSAAAPDSQRQPEDAVAAQVASPGDTLDDLSASPMTVQSSPQSPHPGPSRAHEHHPVRLHAAPPPAHVPHILAPKPLPMYAAPPAASPASAAMAAMAQGAVVPLTEAALMAHRRRTTHVNLVEKMLNSIK
jgi:hypothetical protein